MKQLLSNIRRNRKAWRAAIIFYVPFTGCFMFPYRLNHGIGATYTLIASLIMMGIILAGVSEGHFLKVFFYMVILTVVGMILRYFLEYGEVSNVRNFTLHHIGVFLIIAPSIITVTYKITSMVNREDKQ